MICSASSYFPRGIECAHLVLTLTESLTGNSAAIRGQVKMGKDLLQLKRTPQKTTSCQKAKSRRNFDQMF
jgi:hypothetical protein